MLIPMIIVYRRSLHAWVASGSIGRSLSCNGICLSSRYEFAVSNRTIPLLISGGSMIARILVGDADAHKVL